MYFKQNSQRCNFGSLRSKVWNRRSVDSSYKKSVWIKTRNDGDLQQIEVTNKRQYINEKTAERTYTDARSLTLTHTHTHTLANTLIQHSDSTVSEHVHQNFVPCTTSTIHASLKLRQTEDSSPEEIHSEYPQLHKKKSVVTGTRYATLYVTSIIQASYKHQTKVHLAYSWGYGEEYQVTIS